MDVMNRLTWISLLVLLSIMGTYSGSAPTDDHGKEANTKQKPKGHHWSYVGHYGVDHWADMYPSCGLQRQSPINIKPKKTKYQPLLDHNIYLLHPPRQDTDRTIMVNNGHSLSVQVVQEVYAAGGGLGDSFKVAGFHFHWGSVNKQGSEHLIDSKAYPLEMHIVTYDTSRYATLGEAVTGDDSLAVLGVMFEVVKEDNPYLSEMIHHIKDVQEPNTTNTVAIPHMYLWQLLPSNTHHFFRYYGSLTTPGCFESVVWTVFKTPQTISQSQMNEIRKLHKDSDDINFEHQFMVDNYRPTQPLHGRIVYRSYPDLPKEKVVVVDSGAEYVRYSLHMAVLTALVVLMAAR